MMNEAEKPKPNLPLRAAKWLAGPLVLGFIAGVAIAGADNAFGWDIDQAIKGLAADGLLGPSSLIALATGALMLVVSVIVAVGAFSPSYGIKAKMFADYQDWEDQRGLHAMSAIGCLGWGMLLVILALVEPLGLSASPLLIASLGLCVAVLSVASWKLLNAFDELWHDLSRAMCTWAFYGAFIIGGGWSILAHISLISPLAPLDWISLLTILSLVGSIIANGQRGMLTTD